jgi:hypothetical protein
MMEEAVMRFNLQDCYSEDELDFLHSLAGRARKNTDSLAGLRPGDDGADDAGEPLSTEQRRARARRLFAAEAAARQAALERGRRLEQSYMQEASKMVANLTRAIDKVCKTLDAGQVTRVVDYEVAKGFTVFSQMDRSRMLNAIFAPGQRNDVAFSKAIRMPANAKFLRWALLPVHEGCAADVFKADADACGPRAVAKADHSISDVGANAADARLPRQIGGDDARHVVNNPREAVADTEALVAQARAIRPWMTVAEAEQYVAQMQAEAERVGRRRQTTRYGHANLLERAEAPHPAPRGSSPGRL